MAQRVHESGLRQNDALLQSPEWVVLDRRDTLKCAGLLLVRRSIEVDAERLGDVGPVITDAVQDGRHIVRRHEAIHDRGPPSLAYLNDGLSVAVTETADLANLHIEAARRNLLIE